MEGTKKKVVVAYSGGLDTSYTVMYLAKELGYEVYAACADTGGFSPAQLKANEENAYKLGAKHYVTLDVARENAQQLGANVNFVKLDALNAKPEGEWDVIVSNPPYICEKEKKDMAVNVLEHEPHTALFVPDADPLLFYRAITRLAVQTLSKGGRLYFEINPIYADDTCHMMQTEGMTAVELRSDMYGKQRMAKGVKA